MLPPHFRVRQVLKSFCDRNVASSTYEKGGASAYLDSLGPISLCPNGSENLRKCAHQGQGMSKKRRRQEARSCATLEEKEGQS
ncbi:hypothetical protein JOH52_006969 [Sinorhizobium meliloti]|nr:hypothetical protein [Sinorhizobium meliloti]